MGLLCLWDSPGKNTGVGCHALFQGIFQPRDQTCDSYLLHWRAGFLPLVLPGKPLSLTSLALIFPGGSDSKESAFNAGDLGSIPGSGRSAGEGNGCPLQYSCLENPMDRGAWLGYSPWDRKELDTTEKLTLSLLLRIEECPGEGSRILDCIAISYSKGSSRPRDWTHGLLHLLHWQAGSLTASATWEAATHSSILPWRVL